MRSLDLLRKLLLVIGLSLAKPAYAQLAPPVKIALDSALYLLQTHSLYAKQVNWKAVKDSAYAKAGAAQTLDEAFPALRYAFAQLHDRHGLIASENQQYRYSLPGEDPGRRLSPGIKKEYLKGPRIVTSELTQGVAYLKIPQMIGTKRIWMDGCAAALRDSLCKLLARHPQGLIIDLRMNGGGNYAPMLTGLSPLLGDGVKAYCFDHNGKEDGRTVLLHGVVTDDQGVPQLAAPAYCQVPSSLPVAVLIGPATGSSGEILAMILRDRPRTRLIGEQTSGYLSATTGYFFGKGGYVLMTTHHMAPASKQPNTLHYLVPDVPVLTQDNYENLPADPTVQAAMQWLPAPKTSKKLAVKNQ